MLANKVAGGEWGNFHQGGHNHGLLHRFSRSVLQEKWNWHFKNVLRRRKPPAGMRRPVPVSGGAAAQLQRSAQRRRCVTRVCRYLSAQARRYRLSWITVEDLHRTETFGLVCTANEGPVRIQYIIVWFRFMYSQKWNCAAALFPKQNINVLSSYFRILESVSDLYIPTTGLQTDPGSM